MSITTIAKKIPKFNHEKLFSRIKVIEETGCWEFQGCITDAGYGQISMDKIRYSTHRLSWSIFFEDLNPVMVIDHKCRNRKCCNPDHLREVSRRINMIENSKSASFYNYIKTTCKNGHEFTDQNTYLYSRGRGCKICRIQSTKNWRSRNKK